MQQVRGAMPLPSAVMTVPEDLAGLLADVRQRLDDLDGERAELVRLRDETIIRARNEGGSLREVAELVGMTHMAIKHIEERDTT